MTSMRSLASVSLSFGPINIPMKVYLSSCAEEIGFNMLTPDGNKVKQNLMDAETELPVDRKDVVSGYEVKKDEFVSFTIDELAMIKGERTGEIEVYGFAYNVDVSTTKVERALYLVPDSSDKEYRLLHAALSNTSRMILGKWFDKGKDHLIAIGPREQLLIMYQLYYSQELRAIASNFAVGSEPTEKEIKLATQLIDSKNVSARLADIAVDEYIGRVRRAIQLKTERKTISSRTMNKPIVELSSLLEKTLKKQATKKTEE